MKYHEEGVENGIEIGVSIIGILQAFGTVVSKWTVKSSTDIVMVIDDSLIVGEASFFKHSLVELYSCYGEYYEEEHENDDCIE